MAVRYFIELRDVLAWCRDDFDIIINHEVNQQISNQRN